MGRGLYFSPEKELECLARLLHLPPRRTGQSLDTYAHDLRVAAEHGMANYRRTLTLPHPKKRESQIPILDSLFTNTGYSQRSVSKSRRISGKTSGPNSRARYSGALPPTTSYDGVAPTNFISGLFELNLGRKVQADPEAVMSEWAEKFKDISAKIDAKVEQARQVKTQTSTDQVWYKPGDKGPDGLALWVPKGAQEKSLRPKSSLSRRRPASACSTSRQSLQSRRMAFLSSEVRFPQGFLLDEQRKEFIVFGAISLLRLFAPPSNEITVKLTVQNLGRFVLGIQRLDVAPKIPQSSFGKQAASKMRSPPSKNLTSSMMMIKSHAMARCAAAELTEQSSNFHTHNHAPTRSVSSLLSSCLSSCLVPFPCQTSHFPKFRGRNRTIFVVWKSYTLPPKSRQYRVYTTRGPT